MEKSFKEITYQQQKRWQKCMRFGKLCGCHQIKERSFFYKQFQFPLCARCTGVFIGEFLIAPLIFFFVGFSWLTAFLFLPLVVDGGIQYFTSYNSNNLKRLVSGIMAGTFFGMFVLKLLTLL